MSPDSATDLATLGDVITACSRVMDYTRGASRADLDHNHPLLSACCYQIAVIGEVVKRLSPAMRGLYPEVPWRDIAGMRDRLIHGYDSVDLEGTLEEINRRQTGLLAQVRKIQANLARR